MKERHITPTPCVRQCTLNDDDVCLGCGRTLSEILLWNETESAEQEQILLNAAERLKTFKAFAPRGGAQ